MEVNDAFDAVLLGMFFFGLLFTLGSLLLGVADLGFDAHHPNHGDHFGHGVLNVGVILTFITWFGGVGYLARNGLGVPLLLALVAGVGAAIVGGALIHRLFRYVRSRENVLRPEDFHLPGVIARVTSSIRENGTGEVVYVQQGVRQVSAARAADGSAIPQGAEVVILRSDRGVVYVDLWDRLVDSTESRLTPLP